MMLRWYIFKFEGLPEIGDCSRRWGGVRVELGGLRMVSVLKLKILHPSMHSIPGKMEIDGKMERMVILDQWLSTGCNFAPQGCLVMSGDAFGCHNWRLLPASIG